jgi:type IV pilus assembly protein PilQ
MAIPVSPRTLLFVLPALLAAAGGAATPRKPAAAGRSRVRVSQPEGTRPMTVLGENPALRRSATGGYPAVVLGEPERRWTGEPISLDLKDADIRDVLLTFSKLARLNMVIDPDVRGWVTVRLENVPWDQALEMILKVNGLGYVLEGNIVRVGAPAKL